MRILVGMPAHDSRGGPIHCEPPFVDALRSAGHTVDEETYAFGESGLPVTFLRRSARVVAAAGRLGRKARANQYDIIHLNTSIDARCIVRDLLAASSLRSSGVPVFLKMHGSIAAFLRSRNILWSGLKARLFERVSGVGVLSTEEIENFAAAGCARSKLYLVKNAFRCDQIRNNDHASPFEQERDIPTLLFSSRFIYGKGLSDVVEAVDRLRAQGSEVRAFLLGDGPERSSAEARVRELGLSEQIRFTGYIPEAETAAYHANTDIFVLPTFHDEGFPVVLMKALDAGQAIVTTKIRGAADWLSEPENCLWTTPRSPNDLADKIARLIADEELRSSMSKNNRQLCRSFSPDVVALEYIDVYRKIIERS